MDLIHKRNRRSSSYFFGALLVFVKREGGLLGGIDCRVLKRITNWHEAPISITDKIFACLENMKNYSESNLKEGFWKICVKIGDQN